MGYFGTNRPFVKLGSATIVVALFVWTVVGVGAQDRRTPPAQPENVLAGVIEMHQHSDPDERERGTDSIDAAFYARLRGMRGLVLKSHGQETAGAAWLTAKMVPGIEVVSMITLERDRGGLNKYAIDQFAAVVKKPNNPASDVGIVSFPTEALCRPGEKPARPLDCVQISENGKLVPEAVEVISEIKKQGFILSGGHLTAEDHLLVFQEAKRQGLTQMFVVHANNDLNQGWSYEKLKPLADLGAYIDFSSQTQRPGGLERNWTGHKPDQDVPTEIRNRESAALIRKLGPEHCILEAAVGAIRNEPMPDALSAFIINIRALGFTKEETDLMTKTNPAKLLGLPVQSAEARR